MALSIMGFDGKKQKMVILAKIAGIDGIINNGI